MWIATNTCTGRFLKFLFLEVESMALIAQWCIFFSFFSLLELKNNRAISQVKVYKCNWKKRRYDQFAYMNQDATNMNKKLFRWNICFVSTINKKIIRWKKFTILLYDFFMKENILCILKAWGWIEQLILLDVQFMGRCHCIDYVFKI